MLEKLTAPRLWLAMLLLFFTTFSFAQKRVSGRITAEDGKPVAGATVTAKGTTTSTQTGDDGSFSLSVPQNATRLVVTSVGYDPQEIGVGSGTVTVALRANAATLNEVVVTTGYVTQRKKEVTGAVSVVNVNQMRQQPAGTGEEALQGKASGVTIITSGQPGAGSDIRIRGITGFGNNNPLIIVDGVQANLHDLNVNDIESVQVLKDAAAAIYGIRGSNGVIIVTTKRGRSGKARVSYDGYYGVRQRGPGFDMANTQEEANAIWQQLTNSGLTPGDPNWGNKQFGTGATPVIPDYITPTGYVLCNCPADAAVDPAKYNRTSYQITQANKVGTDWYKEITRNAPKQSHNVSVSSGSDKSSYFFSMNYVNEQGIARYQYLKRYGVRANTQFNVGNHIRLGENLYIFYKENPTFGNQGEGSPFSVAFREDAIIPVYDIAGNFAGTKSQGLGNAQNPFANIYRTKDNRGYNWNITGNAFAEVDLLKYFTVRTSFGGVTNNGYGYNFNYVGYENAEGNAGNNSFSENSNFDINWTFTNTLTFNNTFANAHNVRVLLATEAVYSKGRGLGATRSNYFSENPNFWTINSGPTAGAANSGYAYHDALWSQFARVDYNYKGKYLLNGSIRRDGASVFIGDKRFSYFPSASAAWRISQEDFMKGVTFFNDLKIRYSWGKLANKSNVPGTNAYNLFAQRAGGSYYDISGTNTNPYAGFFASNLGNASTTFEGDIITNIGFDATFLRNKIDLTVDYYKKKVSGLLFDARGTSYDIVFTGGAGLPQVNIGDVQNSGIDGNITYHGAIKRDFKFDIGATFTSYKNEVKQLNGVQFFYGPGIRNVTPNRTEVGYPAFQFYGYKVLGLFQTADEVAKAPTQNDAQVGVFRFADINGDNKIDDNDRTYIGNPNPKFTYGLNIGFNYKSFDFSSFFFGSYGADIYDFTRYYTDFPDFFKGGIRREVAVNAWTPSNTNTTIPKLRLTGGFSTDQTVNSYFISSGSYFRNKQMQLGYTLPGSLLSRFGIERLRVYVQSTDMFTITKYKGLDPELSSPDTGARTLLFGIDQGNYPHTPAYLFGVNLNF